VETLLAQLLLVALFAIAVLKTFWPKRSAQQAGSAVVSPVNELAGRVAALQARVHALEVTLQNQFVTAEVDATDEFNR